MFQETSQQSDSMIWYELRFGRITASILYETAQCQTPKGSLVEKIFSMTSVDRLEMQRGRALETCVLKIVGEIIQKKYGESRIKKSGLLLRQEYPMLGASPDGITDNAVIEIKCPAKEKTVRKYYNHNKINKKYKAQIHLQMLFSHKKVGYFCIADPNFERNKKVIIIKEDFDAHFTAAVMKRAVTFWEKNIFPLLMVYSE